MNNEVWGMDFVADRTADGRPLRLLVVLDEHARECLAIEVGRSFRGEDVVAVLDNLTEIRGAPLHVRRDNFWSSTARRSDDGACATPNTTSTSHPPERAG